MCAKSATIGSNPSLHPCLHTETPTCGDRTSRRCFWGTSTETSTSLLCKNFAVFTTWSQCRLMSQHPRPIRQPLLSWSLAVQSKHQEQWCAWMAYLMGLAALVPSRHLGWPTWEPLTLLSLESLGLYVFRDLGI